MVVIIGLIILAAMILAIILEGKDSGYKNPSNKGKSKQTYECSFAKAYERTDLPFVSLMINGKYEWFLVDSGANINMIKESYFDSMPNKPEVVVNKNGIYTGSDMIESKHAKLTVSYVNAVFKNETFSIAQLNVFEANKEKYGMNIIGIIGSPFMKKYNWSIDYENLIININN